MRHESAFEFYDVKDFLTQGLPQSSSPHVLRKDAENAPERTKISRNEDHEKQDPSFIRVFVRDGLWDPP